MLIVGTRFNNRKGSFLQNVHRAIGPHLRVGLLPRVGRPLSAAGLPPARLGRSRRARYRRRWAAPSQQADLARRSWATLRLRSPWAEWAAVLFSFSNELVKIS